MNTEHKINTIKELIDVITEENVEYLKKDLCSFIDFTLSAKLIGGVLDKNILKLSQSESFTWIDDGQNNATININIIKD